MLSIQRFLGVTPHVFAVFGLCVGYPDPAANTAVKPRLPQSVVLHRETYRYGEEGGIEFYNLVMQAFYNSQQMNIPGDWSEHSVKRVASAESLSGRDRLREALQNLGFLLC